VSRDDLARVAVGAIQLMPAADLPAFAELVAPDAVNHEAAVEPPAARGRGPAAFHATALWMRSAFSGLAFTVTTTAVDGDLVVTHGTMSGRHSGDFVVWTPEGTVERVFAPTGRSFSVHHAHFQRVREGRVVEHWAVRDDQGMSLQLGWVPPSPLFLLRCAVATRRARRGS